MRQPAAGRQSGEYGGPVIPNSKMRLSWAASGGLAVHGY